MALEIGTNNYPNIGQDLAGFTVTIHQNLDAAKKLLGIPVAALDATPGVALAQAGITPAAGPYRNMRAGFGTS